MIDTIKSKAKEPRIWMCIAAVILLFFVWSSYDVSSSTSFSFFGEDYSEDYSLSAGDTYTGFRFSMLSLFGYVTIAFPFIAVLYEFFNLKILEMKIVYIIGSLLSIVGMVVSSLNLKGIASAGSYDYGYGEVTSSANLTIFFWLELLLFIGIIVITIVKEYGVNRAEISSKGVKAVVSDMAENVMKDTVKLAQNVQPLSEGIPSIKSGRSCPKCGNALSAGKKFCSKCGAKIEDEEVQIQPKKTGSSMTVRQYIMKMKSVPCENCGNMVGTTLKFCPNCGHEVVVMIEPDQCTECGEKLAKGTSFCANCGAAVRKKKAVTNCSGCGAELIWGKNFCPECGKPVESEG